MLNTVDPIELLEAALYISVPGDGDAVEPEGPIDTVAFDRDGFPWTKAEDGWMPAGDWTPQPWEAVKKWF